MTITVVADTVDQVAQKLNIRRRRSGINITWRKDGGFDYDRFEAHFGPGCIVDATDILTEDVPRSFKSSAEALRYIAGLLKRHDAYAKEEKVKYDEQQRKHAALKKSTGK